MNTPGFKAENVLRGECGHYSSIFATGRPTHAGLGVVPAGCYGSLAAEAVACATAAVEGFLNPLADAACAAAVIAAAEDCGSAGLLH